MLIKSTLVACMSAAVLVLLGCGSGGGDDDNQKPGFTVGDSEDGANLMLAGGEWYECNSFSSTSTESTYIFTESTYKVTYAVYSNGTCSGVPDSSNVNSEGTYTVGDSFTTGDGFVANKIDFVSTAPVKGVKGYDIFTIEDDFLMFGEGGREFSEAKRPNEISPLHTYSRR